jgi:hypothetical protein
MLWMDTFSTSVMIAQAIITPPINTFLKLEILVGVQYLVLFLTNFVQNTRHLIFIIVDIFSFVAIDYGKNLVTPARETSVSSTGLSCSSLNSSQQL